MVEVAEAGSLAFLAIAVLSVYAPVLLKTSSEQLVLLECFETVEDCRMAYLRGRTYVPLMEPLEGRTYAQPMEQALLLELKLVLWVMVYYIALKWLGYSSVVAALLVA